MKDAILKWIKDHKTITIAVVLVLVVGVGAGIRGCICGQKMAEKSQVEEVEK